MAFFLGYTVVETRIEEQFGTQIFVHSEIDGVFPFHFKVFVVVERVVSPRPAYGITEFYVSVYGDGGAQTRHSYVACQFPPGTGVQLRD